jgi:hypothetical protein
MALGFWFNPTSGTQAGTGPFNYTEAQWRTGLAKYFADVDSIEATQVANPDVDWVTTPDGDYWYGNGPGTFAPPSVNTASAADTTTSKEGDTPVGG